jgi:hypothetical protein
VADFASRCSSAFLTGFHPLTLHLLSQNRAKLASYPLKRLRTLRASVRALRIFTSGDSPSKNSKTLQLGHSLE